MAKVKITGHASGTGILTVTAPNTSTDRTITLPDATGTLLTEVADDAITLAKMASGTDGNVISYDASGNPVAVATGDDGQVLTSAGAGQPPAFEDAASGSRTLLNTTTITTDTTNIDFNSSLITADYGVYEIMIEYMSSAHGSVVDTDLQLSADNGSSVVSSIDQVSHRDRNDDICSDAFDVARKDQDEIQIFSGLGGDRPTTGVGMIRVFSPMDANVHTLVTHITCNDLYGIADNLRNHFGCARDDTAQAINFLRIHNSTGDIEKAKVKLYGVT